MAADRLLLDGGRIVSIAEAQALGLGSAGPPCGTRPASAPQSASPRHDPPGAAEPGVGMGVSEASPVSVVCAAAAMHVMASATAAAATASGGEGAKWCGGADAGPESGSGCGSATQGRPLLDPAGHHLSAAPGAAGDDRDPDGPSVHYQADGLTAGAGEAGTASGGANLTSGPAALGAVAEGRQGGHSSADGYAARAAGGSGKDAESGRRGDDHDGGDGVEGGGRGSGAGGGGVAEGTGVGTEVARRTEYECMICLEVGDVRLGEQGHVSAEAGRGERGRDSEGSRRV